MYSNSIPYHTLPHSGPKTLISTIKERNWEEVSDYLDEARRRDDRSMTALHWAIEFQAPMPALKKIIDSYPQALHHKDEYYQTPLMLAEAYQLPDDGLLYMIDVMKTSNSGTTYNCFICLFLALRNYRSAKVIKRLVDSLPAELIDYNLPYQGTIKNSPVEGFFSMTYFMVEKVLKKISASAMNCVSLTRTQILKSKIKVNEDEKMCTVEYLLHVASMLLNTSSMSQVPIGYEKTTLFSSIMNAGCPWNWCQLLLLVHPEQADTNLIPFINTINKKGIYKKIYNLNENRKSQHDFAEDSVVGSFLMHEETDRLAFLYDSILLKPELCT